jgi:hypothetical protein
MGATGVPPVRSKELSLSSLPTGGTPVAPATPIPTARRAEKPVVQIRQKNLSTYLSQQAPRAG